MRQKNIYFLKSSTLMFDLIYTVFIDPSSGHSSRVLSVTHGILAVVFSLSPYAIRHSHYAMGHAQLITYCIAIRPLKPLTIL
jgi:hypothetical protein